MSNLFATRRIISIGEETPITLNFLRQLYRNADYEEIVCLIHPSKVEEARSLHGFHGEERYAKMRPMHENEFGMVELCHLATESGS